MNLKGSLEACLSHFYSRSYVASKRIRLKLIKQLNKITLLHTHTQMIREHLKSLEEKTCIHSSALF